MCSQFYSVYAIGTYKVIAGTRGWVDIVKENERVSGDG